MKTNELNIRATLPTIVADFELFKKALSEQLEQYSVVVTEDGLAGAKKMSAELNKIAKAINTSAKAKIAEVKEPITAFEGQVKELVSLVQEKRSELVSQTEVFESARKDLALVKITEYINSKYEDYAILCRFQDIDPTAFVKLTALTSIDNLTGATTSAIDKLILERVSIQNAMQLRLAKLEGESYKYGLKTPLTKDDVEPFLAFVDADYTVCLDDKLKSELERQKRIEEQVRQEEQRKAEAKVRAEIQAEEARKAEAKRIEDEAKEKEAREAEEAKEVEAEKALEQSVIEVPVVAELHSTPVAPWENPVEASTLVEESYKDEEPVCQPGGWITRTVTATFKVPVSSDTPVEAIEENFKKLLSKAGINSMATIEVK